MQKLSLDLELLAVESFQAAAPAQTAAMGADTLHGCDTHEWTCPFTG